MRTQRQVVDYSLRKRAVLRDVLAGRVGTYEVCDASPYLKNAARFHGEPTDERCPICRRENLTHVHYIYGDELKQSAGQARTLAELPVLAMTLREFQVFVVEVCLGCDWNHLVEQFLLGRDGLTTDGGDQGGAVAASAAGRHGEPGRAAHRTGAPPMMRARLDMWARPDRRASSAATRHVEIRQAGCACAQPTSRLWRSPNPIQGFPWHASTATGRV